MKTCSCEGCSNIVKARGLCGKHLARFYRHGFTDNPDDFYKGKNIFIEKENWVEFVVENHICKISKEDLSRVQKFTWSNNYRNNYLGAHIRNYLNNPKSSSVPLHYFILQIKNTDKTIVVDHINRDIYDNRRENLRIVPASINSLNTAAKGVYLKPGGNYQAQIRVCGERINIGTYKTYEEAKSAYDEFKSKVIENHVNNQS